MKKYIKTAMNRAAREISDAFTRLEQAFPHILASEFRSLNDGSLKHITSVGVAADEAHVSFETALRIIDAYRQSRSELEDELKAKEVGQ